MKTISLALALLLAPLGSHAQTVARQDWMNHMETALPSAFCGPDSYFRQCFTVTAQECEAAASSATRLCLQKHGPGLPQTLVMPKDGRHWGGVVGQCSGIGTELAMLKKRVSSPRCNDPKQWMQ
ncbi:MAG: hypothetical protein HZC37_27445 [Burkholderiales bacterium]|nr:hypothetical protein [Burkholderiales bacterium]